MSLDDDVRAFHKKFNHSVRYKPTVPPEEEVRFRLRLITEEFFELLGAAVSEEEQRYMLVLAKQLQGHIQSVCIDVDLPEFVDAMGDLEYVITGTRVAMGINGEPIAKEIHRANIEKGPNGPDGKPTKPPNWVAPRIKEELFLQGWIPVANEGVSATPTVAPETPTSEEGSGEVWEF